jgi:hypothetical protein
MKNKALPIQSALEMAENRAKACQVPGHSPRRMRDAQCGSLFTGNYSGPEVL